MEAEYSIDKALSSLSDAGWEVYGTRVRGKYEVRGKEIDDWHLAVVAVVRVPATQVFLYGESIVVGRDNRSKSAETAASPI